MFIFRYGVLSKSEKPKKRFRNIFQQPSGVESECGGEKGSGEVGVAAVVVEDDYEERFRKCEFELLKCENIMRFFTEFIRSQNSFFRAITFFCCCCWCLDCLRKRKASKIWASRSFAPHKHAHTMERNFHLFYSLTKLTSILFLPFYSNIIKAVKRAKVSERRRTICYSVSFRKSLLSPRVCVCARDVCGSVAKE